MFVVYVVLAAVVAVYCHYMRRGFIAATGTAAIATTLLWFVFTIPLALVDGWAGWSVEIPHIAQAAGVCMATAVGVALAVGCVMHFAVRHNSGTI